MPLCTSNEAALASETREFYRRALDILDETKLPFLIGGAWAFGCYTGIIRDTKDIDIFILTENVEGMLQALSAAGYQTELTDSVWLAKAFHGQDLVDLIFNSGNGIVKVDHEWFQHAAEGELLGIPVRLIPAEEMIWSKAFVATRERYDGADIAHLIRACANDMNWARLLQRFGPHWRLLYSYLILFGFIYPGERARIPTWLMDELRDRLNAETNTPPPRDQVSNGTLLSNTQYRIDVEQWGYRDGRRFK